MCWAALHLSVCLSVCRYEAACLLLVYGLYIVVLCFDIRISDFVLRKLSPCCSCLGSGSGAKHETQPLMGWNDDTSLRVRGRSRTDSGIFQDDSGYSHLSLSLHGLQDIPEGQRCFFLLIFFLLLTIMMFSVGDSHLLEPWRCDINFVHLPSSQQNIKVCLPCQRVTSKGSSGFCLCLSSLCFLWAYLTAGEGSGSSGSW